MGACGSRERVYPDPDEVRERENPQRPIVRSAEVLSAQSGWMPAHAVQRILPVDIRRKSGMPTVPAPKKPGF